MITYNFTTDIVIGLEIHVELNTHSKLFCSCPTKGNDEPNSRTCVVCLGHPGSKPVLNKKAVDYALKLCLALKSEIAPELIFSRKSYFYPDMAKNYQITQYELPIGSGGTVKVNEDRINITRAHIEEDPASLVHPAGMQNSSYVLVDYNRSGNPLIEIVTEPDLTSPEQAREFMRRLINILRYLGIFDVNSGIIKADANVSIKESGYQRVEIKNITGFKEIERALKYEIERQKNEVSDGQKIVNETRGWDSQHGVTRSMRTKETEADYGYIIDPDLVPIDITQEWIEKIKKTMPEMPDEKERQLIDHDKISAEDAKVITNNFDLMNFYERTKESVNNKIEKENKNILGINQTVGSFLIKELVATSEYTKIPISKARINPDTAADIIYAVICNNITQKTSVELLREFYNEDLGDVNKYIKEKGLKSVSDSGELDKFCNEAISECAEAIADYKSGNEKSFNFIVGKVMQKTKGKADPKVVRELLKKKLD